MKGGVLLLLLSVVILAVTTFPAAVVIRYDHAQRLQRLAEVNGFVETKHDRSGDDDVTVRRLPVPGGWLYGVRVNDVELGLVFVPTAPETPDTIPPAPAPKGGKQPW
jgi:hypothetical protein